MSARWNKASVSITSTSKAILSLASSLRTNSLSLHEKKQSTSSENMSLCETCNALEIGHDVMEAQRLGSWEELVERSAAGCEGCSFFTTILKTSSWWGQRLEELRKTIVFLNSLRLDCRKPDCIDVGSYSADDLNFDICSQENVHSMSKCMQKKWTDRKTDENPDIDSYHPVPISSRDEKCFDQIKLWFQRCLHHDNCTYFGKAPMPTRLIQVPKDNTQAPKLVTTGAQYGEYIALSHIQHGSDTSKLTTLNFQQSQQEIDLTRLPQNFLDAFEITRRLGFDYIWIKELCIIQDDEDDLKGESTRMVNTYGLATLLISATAASDSQSGILNERHVYYSPLLGSNKDLHLRLRLLRWDWDIERSPLAGNGWAAQERMMSPRVLHFTKRQVIWECASEWCYEASGIPDKRYGSGQIENSYRKAVFQPIVNDKLKVLLSQTEQPEVNRQQADSMDTKSEDDSLGFTKRLRPWLQNIAEYSGRSLSVSSDKLTAVAGMAAIIDDGTVGDYLAGTWSKGIEIGLAWSRQNKLLTRPAEYRAPSWSWASLDGKISYDVPTCVTQPSTGPLYKLRWVVDHVPTLVEHNMNLRYLRETYLGVQKGSYIILEGSCIILEQFLEKQRDDEFFHVTSVLDSSPLFDCPVCRAGGEEEHVDHTVDVGSLWLALYGEKWDSYDGHMNFLMLKKSQDDPTAFERTGVARLSRSDAFGKNDPEDFAKALDSLGFQRRSLRLL